MFLLICLTIYASIDSVLLICELKYMRNPLLYCSDTSRVPALLDIHKLLRQINLLLLNSLTILDDADRYVRIYISYNIKNIFSG